MRAARWSRGGTGTVGGACGSGCGSVGTLRLRMFGVNRSDEICAIARFQVDFRPDLVEQHSLRYLGSTGGDLVDQFLGAGLLRVQPSLDHVCVEKDRHPLAE